MFDVGDLVWDLVVGEGMSGSEISEEDGDEETALFVVKFMMSVGLEGRMGGSFTFCARFALISTLLFGLLGRHDGKVA